MKKLLVVSILFLLIISCEKHIHGCIDPLAINYSPEVTCDDGKCKYSENQ